jgi:hypothetical protein
MTSAPSSPIDHSMRPVRNRSGLAVLSAVLSVVPCACVLAPVLGIVALVKIKRDPTLEGRPLAWAGIVLGTVVSVVIAASGISLANQFRQVAQRPEAAMRAAMAGDGATFRAQMTGPAAQVTSEDLIAWSRTLQERFGALQAVAMDVNAPQSAPAPGEKNDRMTATYILTFDRARVPAVFLFEPPAESRSGLLDARIRRITLEPTDGARIVFPNES